MELIIGTPNLRTMSPSPVVAVGNFDGVHLGHQAILRQAVARAAAGGGVAAVLTFEPHPSRILAPNREIRHLYPFQTKMRLIESAGIARTYVADFDTAFAQQSPETFAKRFLSERLGCREVIVGRDYRFGKDREGTLDHLIALGRTCGFSVVSVEPVTIDGVTVSSSRIRAALSAGDVALAGRMLGRRYATRSKVIRGDGVGKTLGFPTANLRLPNELIPGPGIFAVRIDLLRAEGVLRYDGVVYIGDRPTFGKTERRMEAYLFDFDGDLYDRRLMIHFIDRVRGDIAFGNTADLIARMRMDVDEARHLLLTATPPNEAGGADGIDLVANMQREESDDV